MMPGRQRRKDRIKGTYVIRPVIRRQRDPGEQNFYMRSLKPRQHLLQIVPRPLQRQPAQPVIAAELDDHHRWMHPHDRWQARQRVFRCGSAGPVIDDLVRVSQRIQFPLKKIRISLAIRQPIARGNAVTETNQQRPVGCVSRGGKEGKPN